MKSRLPAQLAKNTSKLHKHILQLLTSEESPFKNYIIRQEVSVKQINPGFHSAREKFDLTITDLKVICECHGRQHYEMIPHFHETKYDFQRQQERDEAKKQAAIDAGWAYVVIKYDELKLTLEELTQRIQEAIELSKEADKIEIKEKPKVKLQNNQKLQSRGFQKPPEGFKYKWPKRKIQNKLP